MYNMLYMSSKHICLAGTATVGPKGQVVIPAEVRQKLNIEPGDKLVAVFVEDKQAISFITEDQVQNLVDQMGEHIAELRSGLDRQ